MPHCLVLTEAAPRENERIRELLTADQGFRCETHTWDAFSLESLQAWEGDVIVAHADRSTTRLLGLADWVSRYGCRAPLFAILSEDTPEDLLRRVGEIADDFMFAPIRPPELRRRLARLLGPSPSDPQALEKLLIQEATLKHFVGCHPRLMQVLRQIPRIARSDAPVLLIGETGTGKELCARAVHHLSPRKAGPFVAVECGALPEHLVENELFGHSRGAFTDAHSEQKGLVAMADGGTLFLDEVDSLSLAAQAKLLRFLQERTFKPLGADRFARSNVRLVAATNRDLEQWIREQRFRSDLYFRINVLRLELPPLRDRRSDIPLLAKHFLESPAEETGTYTKSLSASALRALEQHDWPGNVRELFNVLERARINAPGRTILPAHFGIAFRPRDSNDTPIRFKEARARALEGFERSYVAQMLRKHQGNITRGAREAGKDRRAFGRLVKKYSIDRLNP
jgi:two-component system response regulator GlrR